jgi:hypothetical protein
MKDTNIYETKDGERISMPYNEWKKAQIYWIILTVLSFIIGNGLGYAIATKFI